MIPALLPQLLVRIGAAGILLCFATLALAGGDDWKPVPGHIATRWAKDVSPANCHPEYPRPQMRRREWQSLNGLWDYAVTPIEAPKPSKWDGKILVPFPIESSLSGVGRRVDEKSTLTYRHTLHIPEAWSGHPVLLHFGAVDWHATVSLGGSVLAEHRGGYDGFTVNLGRLDPGRAYDLVVRVEDATGDGQARGKQWREPNGIWFTSTTGIWQSVWMEPVPVESIADLKLTPDIDSGRLRVAATIAGMEPATVVEAVALDAGAVVARASAPAGAALNVAIPHPKLWSPDHPFLYDLRVGLFRNGRLVDQVESYFGMRKIALGKDASGITRLMLNNKVLFQVGQLDQGFWPDGIYTAPTDEALRWDIEETKRYGFNMARKHVKIEPDRWYYWCDKLGLLVWQDMPSTQELADSVPATRHTVLWRNQFEHELDRMIEGRFNHPSIVVWVVFNEGWGQFDTERLVSRVRQLDPSRLIDAASGWHDRRVGDLVDMHKYPGPASYPPEANRASVLGEFGGIGHGVAGHSWSPALWGDPSRSGEELAADYETLLRRVYDLRDTAGLSACVYCELVDVEIEQAGLVTCDRDVEKMPVRRIAAANRGRFHY
jgi:beta-galactosidase/beta-glucuronidase